MKKAEEPPTPPPRPQKTHSRASSLDLNKLFQQGAPGRDFLSVFKRDQSEHENHQELQCVSPPCHCVFDSSFFMGELKGEMEMDGIYFSDWQFRGSHELQSGSDSAGGLILGSWEQRRNIAAGLSVIFCLDFRGKKWVVAPASSSSSETVNFTGRQTVLICWRIKWRKPLSVIKRWSVPVTWCVSGFSFCQRVRESPPAAAKLRRLQSLQRGGERKMWISALICLWSEVSKCNKQQLEWPKKKKSGLYLRSLSASISDAAP